jgi:hypothetical protein
MLGTSIAPSSPDNNQGFFPAGKTISMFAMSWSDSCRAPFPSRITGLVDAN